MRKLLPLLVGVLFVPGVALAQTPLQSPAPDLGPAMTSTYTSFVYLFNQASPTIFSIFAIVATAGLVMALVRMATR